MELHDHGAKTRMTLSDGPYPPAGRGHAEAGYDAALDKLGAGSLQSAEAVALRVPSGEPGGDFQYVAELH